LINRTQPVPNSTNQKPRQPDQPSNRPNTNPSYGTPPTPTQMAEKGSNCNYCSRSGHWASNCRTLIRDVNAGRVKCAQPSPPNPSTHTNPANVRVRAIDATANPSDTILIDSGASACVSGDSPYFSLESRLT
jgi:hypothetical protein